MKIYKDTYSLYYDRIREISEDTYNRYRKLDLAVDTENIEWLENYLLFNLTKRRSGLVHRYIVEVILGKELLYRGYALNKQSWLFAIKAV